MQTVNVNTETLWEQFHGELSAFLRGRMGSDEAAQDLLQNTFLRAHKHLAAGEVPEQPRAWLYQIVRNLIVDARRYAGRQRALVDALSVEPSPESEIADEHDAFSVVARALPLFIDGLDPPYRDALRMTELEGLTQAEAAERAGISLSGMKSRIQRGRKRVYESLQRCCRFELDARGHMMACANRAQPDDCC